MNTSSFQLWARSISERTEGLLNTLLTPPHEDSTRLYEAMRYASLNGGKRLRPMLCYAAAEAVGASPAEVDAAACAVELIHVYSLVHDDMPMMDNDVLRRGKPTVHVQYDDVTALLVGDALQALAFHVLSSSRLDPHQQVAQLRALSQAAGATGMVAGQALDMQNCHQSLTRCELETLHQRKTGALISAAVTLGGFCATNAGNDITALLDRYAQHIGLAFQIVDDVLDVTAEVTELGKTAGKDSRANKSTFASLMGVEGARKLADDLRKHAHEVLLPLGKNGARLAELADFVVTRTG